jgi:hypothetical protein
LTDSHQGVHTFLARHLSGDWGELSDEDRAANALALVTGNPLRSAYRTRLGVPFLVVTEADRSATCLYLPDEL